ncbi:MAG: hypothetical protein E6K18_03850 [Methanobacteriota archaeon]|nr:MAG: hypothetical protein E6K18_03850 [Euryarchaeota archaeon]
MGADDEFDEVRKMINRMLQDAVQGKHGPEAGPHVRGFVGRVQQRDGEAPVRRFIVQVPPDSGLPGPELAADEESVFVTIDLGGTTPSSVHAEVSGRLLFVEVAGARPLRRVVELPHPVEPDARWTVRDGVLDLTLSRRRTEAFE